MGDDQRGAAPLAQVALQPLHRLDVQVVGRLVQDQQVGIREQQAGQHGTRCAARPRAAAAGDCKSAGLKPQPGESLPDARLVGVTAAPLELLLQRSVAFQGRICLAGIAHGGFQAAELGFQLAQIRQNGQAFLPEGMRACQDALPAAGNPCFKLRALWMAPADGSSSPTRMRSRVVFPIPFGPTMAIRAPCGMLSEIPLKISIRPVGFGQVGGGDQRHRCSNILQDCDW